MDSADQAWAERRAGIEFEIERLSRLAVDLKAFCIAKEPAGTQLAAAPVIDRWRVMSRPAPCLVGDVTGHPLLAGAGRRVATSDLVLIDEDRGWARTRSRWYRLGIHAKAKLDG
jgi:hypothetical protein